MNTLRDLLASLAGSGQCSQCGNWFTDWCGGICDGCRNLGRK